MLSRAGEQSSCIALTQDICVVVVSLITTGMWGIYVVGYFIYPTGSSAMCGSEAQSSFRVSMWFVLVVVFTPPPPQTLVGPGASVLRAWLSHPPSCEWYLASGSDVCVNGSHRLVAGPLWVGPAR